MKDERIVLDIPRENKEWLDQRTEQLDCSTAEYVHELIQKHIDIVSDELEHPYDESDRLNTLVDKVYDETDILLREFWGETTDDIDRRYQPGHLHLLVLWRLLAGEYGDAEREYAMQLAQEYVGEDLDIVPTSKRATKWRDTTVAGNFDPSRFRSRGSESGTTQSTGEQDEDTGTDDQLMAADFLAGDSGEDADE